MTDVRGNGGKSPEFKADMGKDIAVFLPIPMSIVIREHVAIMMFLYFKMANTLPTHTHCQYLYIFLHAYTQVRKLYNMQGLEFNGQKR